MNIGAFYVFEGIDFSGKSTQIARLATELERRGLSCVITREPGGTRFAEFVRSALLSREYKICPRAELMLFNACRVQHIIDVIIPARMAGKIVLCDRFLLSTLCYQGDLAGIDKHTILAIHNALFEHEPLATPTKNIILDISADVALQRSDMLRFGGNNSFDNMEVSEFRILRHAYLDAAKICDNAIVINAEQSEVSLALEILSTLGF